MMVRFIAEISSNHNGSLARSLELIRAAAACGCWGVKFQLFRIEQLFSPEVLRASAEHRLRRRWELPGFFIPELARCARDEGLAFGCTPFDLEAVELLQAEVDFLKIASYELPWLDLVRRCAATDLPLMMSVGMADEAEISRAVVAARAAGCADLSVFHCVSNYPVAPPDCNLAAIGTLGALLARDFPGARTGWSDHSVDPGVVSRAIARWGAEVVEFHFDLEGDGAEFGGGHCWLPADIAPVIGGQGCEPLPASDGSPELAPGASETAERLWRADPSDGRRPVLDVRQQWAADLAAAATEKPLVVMVAGGPGLGHLARLLALAEALRDEHGAEVLFMAPDCPGSDKMLARNGFSWTRGPVRLDTLLALNPAVCVLDSKENCTEPIIGLSAAGVATVAIDRPDCSAADLGVVPCFRWPPERNNARLYGGPEYLLIRSDITRLRPLRAPEPGHRIVVSFGGEDPFRLTERCARAMAELPTGIAVDFVVGAGFAQHRQAWPPVELERSNYRVVATGDPLETILPGAGLLVTALGVTVSEAHVLGVPTAVLANYEGDAGQVAQLAAAGAIADLGYQADVGDDKLARLLVDLWDSPAQRQVMAVAGLRLVDGQGARRAADLMAPLLQGNRPRKDSAC